LWDPIIEGCTTSTACNYNLEAKVDDNSCIDPLGCDNWCPGDTTEVKELDCVGVCGGIQFIDCTGQCGLLDVDECGVCGGNNTICRDCNGVVNGEAELDICGDCVGGDTGVAACTYDCTGYWGGSAEEETYYQDTDGDGLGAGNSISLCDANVPAGMVDNNNDSDDDCYSNVHDCLGVCDGQAEVDDCGVCDGGNADQDCAGDCFGSSVVDNCGTCDADGSNDCVQDCAGDWGGTAAVSDFYIDGDGDGLGAGSSLSLCDANVPTGMVANNDDADDDCFSNIHDCLGVCDGTAEVDDCGVCDGGNADQDCAGDCFGSSVVDNCGTCDSDNSNDCTQDCAGSWGGSLVDDECGICGGDNSSCADCAGVPNGDNVEDNCGVCDTDFINDCILIVLEFGAEQN